MPDILASAKTSTPPLLPVRADVDLPFSSHASSLPQEPEPEPAFGSEGASQEGPTYGAESAPEPTDLGTAPALTFREEDDSQAPYQTLIPGGTFVPGVLPESGEGQLAEIGQSGVTGVRRAKARKAATA